MGIYYYLQYCTYRATKNGEGDEMQSCSTFMYNNAPATYYYLILVTTGLERSSWFFPICKAIKKVWSVIVRRVTVRK